MIHEWMITLFRSTERRETPIAKFGRRHGIKGIYHCQERSFVPFTVQSSVILRNLRAVRLKRLGLFQPRLFERTNSGSFRKNQRILNYMIYYRYMIIYTFDNWILYNLITTSPKEWMWTKFQMCGIHLWTCANKMHPLCK